MNRLKLPVLILIVAAVALHGWFSLGTGSSAFAADSPTLKLGEERVPADEAKVIEHLVALQVEIMKRTDPTKRGQHPKSHGCVRAKFTVRDDIPKGYQLGIFKEVKSYVAKIRFSNGTVADDTQPDSHGMAIKLYGVKGLRAVENDGKDEQDFVLADGEEFFAPDPSAVLRFMMARAASATQKDPTVMVQFLKDNPIVAMGLKGFVKALPASPLTVSYFSAVPYKLGDGAVKYTAKPGDGNGPGDAKRDSKDYLRATLRDRLASGKPAMFELSIVTQTDPVKTPIENPTVHWDAKPIPVATITIEAQAFDSEANAKECERIAFDPWNSLADHRPLGGVNRARRPVYSASVKVRHEY